MGLKKGNVTELGELQSLHSPAKSIRILLADKDEGTKWTIQPWKTTAAESGPVVSMNSVPVLHIVNTVGANVWNSRSPVYNAHTVTAIGIVEGALFDDHPLFQSIQTIMFIME
nr:12009_t:CDS:2 [Entrophospora candida]